LNVEKNIILDNFCTLSLVEVEVVEGVGRRGIGVTLLAEHLSERKS